MIMKCLSVIALIFILIGAAADEGNSSEINVSQNALNEASFDIAYNVTNPEYRVSGSPYMRLTNMEDWKPVVPPKPRIVDDMEDPTAVEIYDVFTRDTIVMPSDNVSQQADEIGLNVTPPFEGMPSLILSPISVFPPDDRVRITDTTVYPWRTICKLLITMPDNTQWMGSGALIPCLDGHAYRVLTAGHCVYDPDHGGWASSIMVIPGIDDNYMPYYGAWATQIRAFTGWTQNQDRRHDMAIINLDRNIGDFTGWMGLMTDDSTSPIYTDLLNTAGYPADKGGWTMWYDGDNGRTANEYNHWYYMDTYGGQSGSPVWRLEGSNRYILTVHACGDDGSASNSGTRLNTEKLYPIFDFCNIDTPPADKADLIDDGQAWSGFTPGTITPGRNFNVWSDVRNIGTAPSGGFYVSYYASTNNIISTSDYLIGEDYVSSISPFQYGHSDWFGAFPSIPAGTYYVGWIIDRYNQVTEFDKTNNVAYKDSYLLVVNPPSVDDVIIFRNGVWFVDVDGDQSPDSVFWYGTTGDVPVVGDINKDGTGDIAIFRNGVWFVDVNRDRNPDMVFWYGAAGDIPLVGDFNNDGTDDIAIFRNGVWFVDVNGDRNPDIVFWYGASGDVPLVGDFNNDGTDDIAIFRNGVWFVDVNSDRNPDMVFWYGATGDIPRVGDAA